ncbi:hypothetical protein BLNAU_18132 [Blattamonas nauphoetae]|uniref:Uncharacterized protein n=1 Tax=Blattamonas nauphoetae TaxID=2049346 RepID=A0ABQ9X5P5_9EUKA|nr:hypothetical protein BLNAU_18132 [Blattamonas nauphoetae]
MDDVMIDDIGTIRIKTSIPSHLSSSSAIAHSFSDDLHTFTLIFYGILEDLMQSHLMEPNDLFTAESIIPMAVSSILSSFIQTGDIFSEISSVDLLKVVKTAVPEEDLILTPDNMDEEHIWPVFCQLLEELEGILIVLNHNEIFNDDSGPSERWIQIMRKTETEVFDPERLALEKQCRAFVQMILDVSREKVQNQGDISILRHPAFRETLVRLLSKYQHRVNSVDVHHSSAELASHSPPPYQIKRKVEDIASIGVGSGLGSLHPSTRRSVQSDDLQPTTVNSNQSTSDSITLQTKLPLSEDTDPLSIESANTNKHLSHSASPETESHESTTIVELLQSLIAAPPINSDDSHEFTDETILVRFKRFPEHSVDLTERFSVSLFAEDEASILHSLERCQKVCKLIPPEQCIENIPDFVEMLVSALTSTSLPLGIKALMLLGGLLTKIDFCSFLHNHLHSLKTSFREGTIGAQQIYTQTVMMWVANIQNCQYHFPHVLRSFDWEGFLGMDLDDLAVFQNVLKCLRLFFFSLPLHLMTVDLMQRVFITFETQSHLTTKCLSILKLNLVDEWIIDDNLSILIIIAVFFGCPVPLDVFDYLKSTTLFTIPSLSVSVHPSIYLNHTSISSRRNPQQLFLMELFLERTLQKGIHQLFLPLDSGTTDESPAFLNTAFFGLHSLFHRGFQIVLNESSELDFQAVLWSSLVFLRLSEPFFGELFMLYSCSPPPNIIPFFASAAVYLRHTFKYWYLFSAFFIHLLQSCAPFGECQSFSKIVQLIRESGFQSVLSRGEKIVFPPSLTAIINLHWFNLPVAFDSPYVAFFPLMTHLRVGLDWARSPSNIEVEDLTDTGDAIGTLGSFFPHLVGISVTDLPKIEVIRCLNMWLLTPCPSAVSVVLAFLTRIVAASDNDARMVFVRVGLIDLVIAASVLKERERQYCKSFTRLLLFSPSGSDKAAVSVKMGWMGSEVI